MNFIVDEVRVERFMQSKAFQSLAVSRKRKDKVKKEKEILAGKAAQKAILKVLDSLRSKLKKGKLIKDRARFEKLLVAEFNDAEFALDAALKKALLAPGSLGEKDPTAEICYDTKGNAEPDGDLRDTENVPLPEGISLPLPIDYQGKTKSVKPDVTKLLELVQKHCEDYLTAEVLPYRKDAWIDHSKIKVGYEIPYNRHFYEYEAPQSLDRIEKDIAGLEKEIIAMLKEVA